MSQEVIAVVIQNPEQPVKAILVPGTEVVGFAELTNVGPDGLSGYSGFSGIGTSGFSGYSGFSGFSGFCGLSGYSGFSSSSGFSGFCGLSGFSGFSGKSGYSGFSGSGISGYSGFCGATGATGSSGFSGYSGFCGLSGYSGFCGVSGYSGYSGSGVSGYSGYSGLGLSGFSGFCGLSGYSGFSSTSGYSGFCGLSGYSGFCGLSGYSGFSGVGASGFSGYSGAGLSGFSGFCGLSGYSGFCGLSGYSGFCGIGTSGFSGFSGAGTSGFSGFCGLSGYSGFSGPSGYSGFCGTAGAAGTSGFSGYSGAGLSGFSGFCGLSGYSGFSGKSGYSGFSGSGTTVFSVVAAANTNQAITTNLPTIDDVSTSENDRVLLTQQGTDSENGVWVVHAASAWTRPLDFANGALIPVGTLVHVEQGTQYPNVYFSLIGGIGDVTTFTVGTSAITSEGLVDPFSWDRNDAGHTLATGGVIIPNGLQVLAGVTTGTALQGEVLADKIRVGSPLSDMGTGTVNVSGGYYVDDILLSAVSGFSGYSGFSGKSGYSGFCGLSGYSGFSSTSGFSGFSGKSGYSGFSAAPAGSTTQVQYNNAGAFGGTAGATASATQVTLVSPLIAAGSTSAPSLNLAAGTLETTPADGDIEIDADCFYGCTDAGNRGVMPNVQIIRADATVTQANDNAAHAIFTTPTNGRLTMEAGTYRFHGQLAWTAMSATSGNIKVDLLGAGTATTGGWLWRSLGQDIAAASNATNISGMWFVTSASGASVIQPQVNTAAFAEIDGTFEVTGAGTLIPTQTLVTAAAAVLSVGSFIEFWRVGSTSMTSVGQWD